MAKKLDLEGFLIHEKYRGVKLTEKGKKLPEVMQNRHQLITTFLMLFGVRESVARQDARRIEHGVHPDTLDKLGAFTEYILSNPELIRKYRAICTKKAQGSKS
jgi:Mn-dependent DtxR family transcriptional regulator